MNSTSDELFVPASPWSGRDDGPGPEHARWHSVITPWEDAAHSRSKRSPGVALLGFASDEGVFRNEGRQGAAEGPAALRGALGSLAVHHDFVVYDAGTITTQGEDLEGAHDLLSDKVAELTAAGMLTVVLGGGHETAFGSHRGARASLGEMTIINLDAHFDLRSAARATSGTPFAQIAKLGGEFDYSVFGISRPNNTQALFDTAAELGVRVVLDEQLLYLSPREAAELAARAADTGKPVHLSIDLDVLPAAVAPGVSAPAGLGVSLEHIFAMATAIAATGALTLVDVVELNPRFDIDNRTAKTAARLIDAIATTHLHTVSQG